MKKRCYLAYTRISNVRSVRQKKNLHDCNLIDINSTAIESFSLSESTFIIQSKDTNLGPHPRLTCSMRSCGGKEYRLGWMPNNFKDVLGSGPYFYTFIAAYIP